MLLDIDGQAAPAPALVHLLNPSPASHTPAQAANLTGPTEPDGVHEGAAGGSRAPYMRLGWSAVSTEAKALCHSLLKHLQAATGSRKSWELVVQGFAGALIASLRRPAPRLPMYRPWTTASFDTKVPTAVEGIGYRPAREVRDALVQLGYLEQAEPHRFGVWVLEPSQERPIRLPDKTAAYRASILFETLAASHGGPNRCLFKPTMPPWPVVLYPAKKPNAPTSKKPRRPIVLPVSVKRSSPVAQLVQTMRDLNAFLASFELTHGDGSPAFAGLHRVFSLPIYYDRAQLDQYGWDVHGRIYAAGNDDGLKPYQSIDSKKRPELLIDGETTAELDIRASWPTIVYGLMDRELPGYDPDRWSDKDADPYSGIADIETDEVIPRDVIKAASSIFLTNTGRYLRQWPGQAVDDLRDQFPNLRSDYPAQAVGKAMLTARPHLVRWKSSKRGHGFTLMAVEAEMLLAAMHRAMAAGIASYPIHDALIVPESQAEVVLTMLVQEFIEAFGARPHVRVKVALT